MASPFLASFCCMVNHSANAEGKALLEVHPSRKILITDSGVIIYNALCAFTSTLGILGAIYQLWPKKPLSYPRGRREVNAFLRQNSIVCSLALADLLAAFGILVRSLVWLGYSVPLRRALGSGNADFPHLFCAVSSGWIQYFYITTYMWTFCYALDTYLLTKDNPGYPWVYSGVSWALSALICGAGLVSLYKTSLLKCAQDTGSVVPHFLSSYIPILLVIIANPVLYVKSSHAVRESLACQGQYTDRERNILAGVKKKFFLMMLVFYCCWVPNILNGILLIFWRKIPFEYSVSLWQLMAVVNPVQAFLNSLVYHGVGCRYRQLVDRYSLASSRQETVRPRNHIQASIGSESSEHSPLLNFRR